MGHMFHAMYNICTVQEIENNTTHNVYNNTNTTSSATCSKIMVIYERTNLGSEFER